jgi:hypothetical protein
MTDTVEFRKLKTLAKLYARANRIALHDALDRIAGHIGFAHWNNLAAATKKGWTPDPEVLTKVEAFVASTHPALQFRETDPQALQHRFGLMDQTEEGRIGTHPYRLSDMLGDVLIAGEGWCIRIPEAPDATPTVETAGHKGLNSPVHDPAFLREALQIARERSTLARARISTDWPRRSTKPDGEGSVRHPLFGGESSEWFCLHCNSTVSGAQIAANLWHCPGCGASPLDIFKTPFWLGDNAEKPEPVRPRAAENTSVQDVQIVDGTLKLELDAEKISLLIRSALVEDATNASERLGALLAEISVDEENDVWIVFDEDLWPEDKDPVQALAVAELLGIEVELAITCMTTPFAWPGLGTLTSSTRDYTKMMLNAYARHEHGDDGK